MMINMNLTVKKLYEQVRDGRIISDIELQREIVYDTEKQKLVIDSIVNKIPLPAFYFWKNNEGKYEVLDGKQRVESITRFLENDIEYDGQLWKQTDGKIQEIINNTELSIIICEGPEELKREIFRRINTLGVPLSDYEVLNGLFNGEYLRGLTRYVQQDKDVITVLKSPGRGKSQYKILQLLIVLKKINKNRDSINEYVEKNQCNSFSDDQRLISKYIKFIRCIFDDYKQLDIYFNLAIKYQKDVSLWKKYKVEINSRIKKFLKSQDAKIITDKAKEIEDIIQATVNGISVDEKRLFSSDDKKKFLTGKIKDDGKCECAICQDSFFLDELEMDHIKPWSLGGRTVLSNAQLLCSACNRKKGNK